MEEKKTFKEWWSEKTSNAKEWIGKHPDVILTVLGGLMSLSGGLIKLYANKTEYEDNLYTTIDNDVYKVPAKKMKTAKYVTPNDPD